MMSGQDFMEKTDSTTRFSRSKSVTTRAVYSEGFGEVENRSTTLGGEGIRARPRIA